MSAVNLTKNTTYFTLALTVQKILAFIYFWFISNNLFPGQLGQYVFALSFTTLFSIFIDLGLSPILTREASKDTKKSNDLLNNVLGLKLPLTILTALAVFLTINLSGKETEITLLVYLATLIMILDSFSLSFWVVFRAHQNLKYESIATILIQIIIFILGIFALNTTGEVKHLIMALLVASIFNLIFVFSLIKAKLKFKIKLSFDKKTLQYFLKVLPAFALAGIFVKIYNTSDSVLLSYLSGDEAVGFFAVPAKVIFAFQQIIPAAFAAVMYPAFSLYYKQSKEKLEQIFTRAFNYLMIVSVPMAAGLAALSPEIIETVWPSYKAVIPTFFIMTFAIPFMFLAFPTGYLLNASDRQNKTTFNRGVITVMAIALNLSLIPQLGFLGAGITFLVTNLILLFLDIYWVREVINVQFVSILKTSLKTTTASLLMALLILAGKNQLGLTIIIPLGALSYFVFLYLFKGFSLKEITEIKKSFKT